jgi:hypothetical protein
MSQWGRRAALSIHRTRLFRKRLQRPCRDGKASARPDVRLQPPCLRGGGGFAWTWWCATQVLSRLGTLSRAKRYNLPRPSSAMDPRVTERGLPGYPHAKSPPIIWWQVEGSMEQVCLRVAAVYMLLRETMVMVGQDILHPIWVG